MIRKQSFNLLHLTPDIHFEMRTMLMFEPDLFETGFKTKVKRARWKGLPAVDWEKGSRQRRLSMSTKKSAVVKVHGTCHDQVFWHICYLFQCCYIVVNFLHCCWLSIVKTKKSSPKKSNVKLIESLISPSTNPWSILTKVW